MMLPVDAWSGLGLVEPVLEGNRNGVAVLEPSEHRRALELSDAWEAANAWITEPDYAAARLERLQQRRNS